MTSAYIWHKRFYPCTVTEKEASILEELPSYRQWELDKHHNKRTDWTKKLAGNKGWVFAVWHKI